ncbi:hypothetical protein [Magnetofaba australis]|nr:hypothetical protein [Magnetofaba australis]
MIMLRGLVWGLFFGVASFLAVYWPHLSVATMVALVMLLLAPLALIGVVLTSRTNKENYWRTFTSGQRRHQWPR